MKKTLFTLFLLSSVLFFSCQKIIENWPGGKDQNLSDQTKTYSSEVPVKWLEMQLPALRTPPGASGSPQRCLAYCGVALYEAVLPGMPSYRTLSGQLNGLPSMPKPEKDKEYHWAVSANAALAYVTKNLLATTSAANKASMDSLEKALNEAFKKQVDESTFQRSVNFGTEIGRLIFEWSKLDGSLTVYPPYVLPVGPGFWVSTPPNFPAPANPYGGTLRLIVAGSINGTDPAPLPGYSTNPNSAYYDMVRDVYNQSLNNTPDQVAKALYYRDGPGYPGGGHFVALLPQVLTQARASLDIAAVAYAKAGMGLLDAVTGLWKVKYTYNVERPITYIRTVLGHPDWNALFNTPGHPDFPSGHSNQAGAFEEMMADVFGQNFQFTNNTYANIGLLPRSYKSFEEMAIEMGESRFFGGIHYLESCVKGRTQGKKIARNILNSVKFKS